MDRLFIKSEDAVQKTSEGLRRDLERRILAGPPGQCPTDLTASFLRLCHSQSCGKCVPCRIGLGQLQRMIDGILNMDSESTMEDLALLEKTAEAVCITSDCVIGADAAGMVLRGIRGYRDDFESHIRNHCCTEQVCADREPVPCVALCPAGVDIPGYVALVRAGRYDDAVKLIRKDNPFPAVCGLICEHPCETRCRRNFIDAPINIRGLKRFAADHCGQVPVPVKIDKTGKKIAVIGGGPGGLSAAYFLSIMGHDVTVFEKRDKLGGMLRYGIPNYRLPRHRLQWDIDAILSTGIQVRYGCNISTPQAMAEIRGQFDATYISIGAHNAKEIGIPGEYARGVIPAVEMLRGIGDGNMPDFNGKSVIVIGGGNVAMDAARTAMRLGASDVRIAYRRRKNDMTALPEEVESAAAEGCELLQLMAPSWIEINHKGEVQALWVKPQIAGKIDRTGRPEPADAAGEEQKLRCDIVLSAIGQASDTAFFEEYGIPVFRGKIRAGRSSVVDQIKGIYAGGDCVTGPSTAIKAIGAGKVAAANIDEFLGFHHVIETDVEIPLPAHSDNLPWGRTELKSRYARHRGNDFEEVEQGMSPEEMLQEASRCLRCDCFGFGLFRGGRNTKW